MPRPDLLQVPESYHGYINQVQGNDFLPEMKFQTADFIRFLKKIPESKRSYRYARGKWTIKELLLHIIDAERIFAYRALCFARKDKTSLPSFDENEYALNSKAAKRNWDDMVTEFKNLRTSNEILFGSFDREQTASVGVANNKTMSVNALGFIIVGHVSHHLTVIKERYL